MAVVSLVARLSAQSAEFEKTFSKASQTAAQFEKQYGSMASSVAAHQARINKAFQSFTGDKVIAEANAYASAVTKVGGAAKLTETEQRKVNASVTEAIAKYKALGQDAPKALHDLAAATTSIPPLKPPDEKFGGFFSDLTKQVGATAAGFISAQAVIGGVSTAFRTLVGFVSSSIDSFAAAEAAQKKLTAALTSQGRATPDVIAQYDQLAATFQKTTVYSDDLINEMQALLVQVGNVMPNQMEGALKAATDLASGLGIDLRTATLLVGKAFEGETGTLKKYGIVIDEAKLKAEGLPAVLDAINKKFGGQAASEAETYAGKIQQIANSWDNLKEAVGKQFVSDPVLIAFLRTTNEELTKAPDKVSAMGIAWNVIKAQAPEWVKALGALHHDLTGIADAANAAASNLARVTANAPKLNTTPAAPRPNQFGVDLPDVNKVLDDAAAAQQKATAAAEAHAKALKELNDRFRDAERALVPLTSAQATQITHYLALNLSVADIAAKMHLGTREVQQWATGVEAMNKVVEKSIPLINRWKDSLAHSADNIVPMIQVVSRAWPTMIEGLTPVATATKTELDAMAKAAKRAGDAIGQSGRTGADGLGELAASLAQLAQIAGASFGTILSGASTVVHGFASMQRAAADYGKIANKTFADTASYTISAGTSVIGIYTSLVSIVDSWWSAGQRAAKAASAAMREAFHAALELAGSYAELKTRIEELGFSWEKLSATFNHARGDLEAIGTAVGRAGDSIADFNKAYANSPQGLAEANYKTREQLIAAEAQAKKTYEFMLESGKYTASELARAFAAYGAAHRAAMEDGGAAADAAAEKVKALSAEFDSLSKSVSAEAPEEVMGVIEQQQRARLAAIAEEKMALQAKADEDVAVQTEAQHRIEDESRLAHDRLQDFYHHNELEIRYHYTATNSIDVPGGNQAVPRLAAGGIVRKPTLALIGEAGPEAVIPLTRPVGSSAIDATRGDTFHLTINGNVDSDERAAQVVRDFATEVRRGGRSRTLALSALGCANG